MQIEILGPSGVGKSTTLRVAQEMRADEPEWIEPREVDEILQRKPVRLLWPRVRFRYRRVSIPEHRRLLRATFDDPGWRVFIDHCVSVVTTSSMLTSQKLVALSILQTSCYESLALRNMPNDIVLVHDELLLHRAYSLLLYSSDVVRDATTYFKLVPLPDAAVIFYADEGVVLSRLQNRTTLPNCYAGQDEAGRRRVVAAGIEVAHIAQKVLRARGLAVKMIESSMDVDSNARELHEFVVESATV